MLNFTTTIYTRWRVVDSHWRCVEQSVTLQDGTSCPFTPAGMPCLAEYLLDYGFKIPGCITYCLAENDRFRIKYRVHGGSVNLYINPVHNCEQKVKQNEQNSPSGN